MKRLHRILSTAAAGAVVAGALAVVPVSAAQATIADCTTYKFVSIPYDKSGSVKKSVDLGGGRKVELHVGAVNGSDHGWAKISGSTQQGDLVWMDWSTTGGKGHIQCGPFAVQKNGSPNTSAAKKVEYSQSSYVFRACGKILGGDSRCTGWW
ncbi:hypothetical protein ACWDTT_28155 [Streptosporangium sandarakinum]